MTQPVLYAIENTDGSQIITIQPKTFDGAGGVQHTTELTLYGNAAPRWGERFNENFLRLLENFACPDDGSGAPANVSRPIRGQLWFDTTSSWIKVYDGSSWNDLPDAGLLIDYYTRLEADDTFYDKDTVDSLLNGKISWEDVAGNGLVLSGTEPDYLLEVGTPSNVTLTSTNIVTSNSHTHALNDTGVTSGAYGNNTTVATFTVDVKGRLTAAGNTTIRSASTSQTGIVQLNNTITSTSTTQAATANVVRQVAESKVTKAGDTMTGFLTLHANPTNALHAATKQYVDDETEKATFESPIVGASGTSTLVDGAPIYANSTYWREVDVDTVFGLTPGTASFVFIEVEGAISGPDSGTVIGEMWVTTDLTSAVNDWSMTNQYLVVRGRASGDGDNVAVSEQGIFPLNDGKFRWRIAAPGFNQGWVWRMIGYL
jgi:hypothetical protein